MVEQCFDRCAAASLCTIQLHEKVERFMGSIMKNHETNRGKVGLQLVKNEQVRPAGQAGISHFTGSFVGHSPSEMLCPPAFDRKSRW